MFYASCNKVYNFGTASIMVLDLSIVCL
jgi:hypothetical protein